MKTTKLFNLNRWDIFLIGGFTAISILLELTGTKNSTQLPVLGFVAGLLSILCSIYGAKGNIINFFFGFIGSILTAYIAFRQQLWSNFAIYLLFNAPIQIVGLVQWKKRLKENTPAITPRWMSWRMRIITILTVAAATIGLTIILSIKNDPQPLLDSATTLLIIVAQLMLTFAFTDLWFVWIIFNTCNIIMWSVASRTGDANAILTLVRTCFFMLNTIYGIINWIRLEHSGKKDTFETQPVETDKDNNINSDGTC